MLVARKVVLKVAHWVDMKDVKRAAHLAAMKAASSVDMMGTLMVVRWVGLMAEKMVGWTVG